MKSGDVNETRDFYCLIKHRKSHSLYMVLRGRMYVPADVIPGTWNKPWAGFRLAFGLA